MTDNYLKRFGIRHLHYMTHIDNVPSILADGILPHSVVTKKGLAHKDIADAEVQQHRNGIVPSTGKPIHEYVPLYLATQTPMQYVITHPARTRGREQIVYPEDLVFIDVDAGRILGQSGVVFCDGNAASSKTSFYNNLCDLDKLDWKTIHCPGDYKGSGGKCYDADWKRNKSSEVLVPERIASDLFSRFVVYDQDAGRDLVKKAQAKGARIQQPIVYDKTTVYEYYF